MHHQHNPNQTFGTAPQRQFGETFIALLVLLVLWIPPASAHSEEAEPFPWSCSEGQPPEEALAASEELLATQWRTYTQLRRSLGNLKRYTKLRPLYIRAGVCDVGRFLTDGIVTTRFLGRPIRVHTRAVTPLARVEEVLLAQTTSRRQRKRRLPVRFARVGTFHARSIRTPYGPIEKLSRHGLGLAMDIDPQRNPFLSVEELEVLTLVSGVTIDRRSTVPAGERWDTFQEAAVAFRKRLRPWLRRTAQTARRLRTQLRTHPSSEQEAELEQLEAHYALVRGTRLRTVRSRGFLSLPRAFVVAMEEAGFVWATDFPSGADLMHFELRQRP
ncbi:MAG: hypothetical protein AAFX99_21885 [Myxococcota bacterium]